MCSSCWRSSREADVVDIGERRRRAHREPADLLRRGQIPLHERRRHLQHAGDVVEPIARVVGGKQRVDVDVEIEQIANDVPVFGAIQAMERLGSSRVGMGRRGASRAPTRPSSRSASCVAASGRGLPAGGIRPVRTFRTTRSQTSASAPTFERFNVSNAIGTVPRVLQILVVAAQTVALERRLRCRSGRGRRLLRRGGGLHRSGRNDQRGEPDRRQRRDAGAITHLAGDAATNPRNYGSKHGSFVLCSAVFMSQLTSSPGRHRAKSDVVQALGLPDARGPEGHTTFCTRARHNAPKHRTPRYAHDSLNDELTDGPRMIGADILVGAGTRNRQTGGFARFDGLRSSRSHHVPRSVCEMVELFVNVTGVPTFARTREGLRP